MADEEKKGKLNPAELLNKICKGKMKLFAPILADGKEVAELEYDFSALTGHEVADALDSDKNAMSVFHITNEQAFVMFAKAAAKKTEGIDEYDIRERMGSVDGVKAVQMGTLFFNVSNQVAATAITSD